ncbi:PmgT [Pectobacterium carotovorum]|uniref:PmgT n=1 Tax=Pectobacterium carotovorum TaxID=554 RepID=UPI00027E0ADD|nr:PmgT [Pectobacterium carotovorum]AFR03257.1 PmgT [Pectobacterium carotovorum subsp. carotovorum PCC21]
MKERGIIFNGDMVRAIIDGLKTQTRRVMKPQPTPCDYIDEHGNPRGGHQWPSNIFRTMLHVERELQNGQGGWKGLVGDACPYGDVGDRIWVRETWMPDAPRDGTWPDVEFYGCKGAPLSMIPDRFRRPEHCIHRASWTGSEMVGWTPSIHMPRWASRILLEITDVRVERLNDISEEDCWAEGIDAVDGCFENAEIIDMARKIGCCIDDAKPMFSLLWQSIYGAESWSENPWVWAVSFKRIEGE